MTTERAAHDVLVIGAGPYPGADAVAVAREIADRLPEGPRGRGTPARVVLVAHTPPGCDESVGFPVPTSRVGPLLLDWAARGLTWEQTRPELATVRDRLLDTDGTDALHRAGVGVLRGTVAFLGQGRVGVGDRVLTPRRVVIATGAVPAVPDLAGILDVRSLTSANVLDQETLPESLIVLGAGAVGCELAQGLARLGVSVTLVDAATRVLPDVDPEPARLVERALRDDGVRMLLGAPVAKVAPTLDGGAWIGTGSGGDVAAQALLVATGRRAHTHALQLAAAGIATDPTGAVAVDDRLRTGAGGVFAVGEVTGLAGYGAASGPMARVAAAQVATQLAPRTVVRRPALRWASPVAARMVRTDPELVQLGTVTEQALDGGASSARCQGPSPGAFVRVSVGAPAGRGMLGLGGAAARDLLGAVLVGPGACEAAGQLVLALNAGLPAAALIDTAAADGSWAAAIQVAVAHALVARD